MSAQAVKDSLLKVRWMVFALVLLALAVGALLPGQVTDARPSHMVEHRYYDGPTYANQVGYKWVTCSGIITSGQVTQWVFTIDGGEC